MASIFGFEFADLDPDEYPMGVVVILKYMDADGDPGMWYQRAEVSPHEAIGMSEAYADQLRADLVIHHDADDD